jgi:hypothetical protein
MKAYLCTIETKREINASVESNGTKWKLISPIEGYLSNLSNFSSLRGSVKRGRLDIR